MKIKYLLNWNHLKQKRLNIQNTNYLKSNRNGCLGMRRTVAAGHAIVVELNGSRTKNSFSVSFWKKINYFVIFVLHSFQHQHSPNNIWIVLAPNFPFRFARSFHKATAASQHHRIHAILPRNNSQVSLWSRAVCREIKMFPCQRPFCELAVLSLRPGPYCQE